MTPLTARQVEEILSDHGFLKGHGKGSHVGWYNPVTGRQTVVPHHGSRVLKQGTLQEIFRQAGVPKPR